MRAREIISEIDENEFSSMALDLLGKEKLSHSLKSVVGAAVYNSKRLEISQKETEKLIEELIKRLKKDGLQMKRKTSKPKTKFTLT